jgi:hypothetical protein
MSSLAPALLHNAAPTGQWLYVTKRFSNFIENLGITQNQNDDGIIKQAGVRDCLNRHYYGYSSNTENSILTGSWGKSLRVRPPRDIDVMFVLPWHVFHRFEERQGNRQAQLLQEVKNVLGARYVESDMKGDGQAVVVRFSSMPVEVVPAFRFDNGQFWICDSKNGGRYITTDPNAELYALDQSDQKNSGATRHLIRMAKQWQRHCNVPIKSFLLERFAAHFLNEWDGCRHYIWYDWMVRDFFAFMAKYADGTVTMPGTASKIHLGNAWLSKVQTAHSNAVKACDYEKINENLLAGLTWQNIFGTFISADAT